MTLRGDVVLESLFSSYIGRMQGNLLDFREKTLKEIEKRFSLYRKPVLNCCVSNF